MKLGKVLFAFLLIGFFISATPAGAGKPIIVDDPETDEDSPAAMHAVHSSAVPPLPPAIIGDPVVDSPLNLLSWPQDVPNTVPDLTEPTANRLNDLHARFSDCDFALSSAGNYHMALRELWYDVFLPNYTSDLGLKNWFYITSPPITLNQIKNKSVVFGNVSLTCRPQVAVGPPAFITQLTAAGYTTGAPVPVFHSRGNVLLVKKGNPKYIQSVWDLRRPDVSVVTPNPSTEKSTFDNYSQSIYSIAANDDQNAPGGWDAVRLFNAIFNASVPNEDLGVPHVRNKWFIGTKIHHREVPWSIAYGQADAGVLFYHLALNAVQNFPDLFEIVPLGGTADDPQPLPGNRISTHQAIRINGAWTPLQQTAADRFIDALNSSEFTRILTKYGLTR
jgi:hypothetical protein